jgi:uncharacterized protein
MSNLSQPLSDQELERLNRFLLNRVTESEDDDADTDRDEGILNISELDGFLTAIVSGPTTLVPSRWLPALWGDEEPVWDSAQQFQEIFSLIVRHMNGIAAFLGSQGERFEPLFLENRVQGKAHLVVDEWCYGYVRAMTLDLDAWEQGDPEIRELLAPIRLFGTEPGWEASKQMNEVELARQRDAIPDAAHDIYDFWLSRRAPVAAPLRRESPKVGRNEPCPCGSGRKFKHCCLQ